MEEEQESELIQEALLLLERELSLGKSSFGLLKACEAEARCLIRVQHPPCQSERLGELFVSSFSTFLKETRVLLAR